MRAVAEFAPVPYGVNLFSPQQERISEAALARAVEFARPAFARAGLELPEVPAPDYGFGWEEKLAAIERAAQLGYGPQLVSSTFGCFTRAEARRLERLGIEPWVTVTSVAEAVAAEREGIRGLIVQGAQAGGHRGTWTVSGDVGRRTSILSSAKSAGPPPPRWASCRRAGWPHVTTSLACWPRRESWRWRAERRSCWRMRRGRRCSIVACWRGAMRSAGRWRLVAFRGGSLAAWPQSMSGMRRRRRRIRSWAK